MIMDVYSCSGTLITGVLDNVEEMGSGSGTSMFHALAGAGLTGQEPLPVLSSSVDHPVRVPDTGFSKLFVTGIIVVG